MESHSISRALKIAVSVLVAILVVGCSSATTSTPKPSPSTPKPSPGMPKPSPSPSSFSAACTTSAAEGGCGPYDTYRRITGITSSTYVGNNVWNPISGWRQTLYANSPGNWRVTANMPTGNTAVVSYPSVGVNYGQVTDIATPLTDYSSILSSFSENMNATARTSAWAAYDVWLGPVSCSPEHSRCTRDEVMIQHDFANNSACPTLATAAFGGSGGVPVQNWHLCKYGSELIWKLTGNEHSGRVNLLPMLTWLENHGYLPTRTGLWSIGYGWEICSTGGQNEDFQVSSFSLTPVPSRSAS
jgi:hypothetical protein